ncbi:MAG TPA: hypothetical protein VL563_03760, partial [Gemmatimonadales bacterium]|nr:hypothetical protein [Gemmatimonadales bacterium]
MLAIDGSIGSRVRYRAGAAQSSELNGFTERGTPHEGPSPMATGRLLTVTSLLSLVLLMLHVSDDNARGISPLNFASMIAVLVVAMLLYATLTGEGRRAGAVSGFLIGLFA